MRLDQTTLEIQIPYGAKPNDRVTVVAPDGRTIEILVPVGCHGGQRINIVIDNNVSGGSTSAPQTGTFISTDAKSSRAAIGIAAAAAVTGLILVGPIAGVAVAGAALYATTREDSIGDAARQGGVVACSTFDFGMMKAKEHNIFERLKDAGQATYQKAVEVNNELRITEQASTAARDLNNEHHITDRLATAGVEAISRTPGAMSALFKLATSANPSIKK